jgi:hypothetical protein
MAPEHQEKVRFARAFSRYLAEKIPFERPETSPAQERAGIAEVLERPPKRQPLFSFLPFQSPLVSWGLAAAILVLMVGVGWIAWKSFIKPPGGSNVLAVSLRSGLQRSAGETKRIVLTPDIGTVRLELVLSDNQYPSYEVTVQDSEGRTVTSETNLRAQTANQELSVFVNVDASLLKPADYRVKLSGVSPDGNIASVASYSFRVVASETQ